MIKLYIIGLIVLCLALYGVWLEKQNLLLYKVRKRKTKSALILNEMEIVYHRNEGPWYVFKEESIDFMALHFVFYVFLCFKTTLLIQKDGKFTRYNDLPYQFRKLVYSAYLKKRYARLFANLSIDKEKVFKKIEATKNVSSSSLKYDLKEVAEKLCQLLT